MAKKPANKTVAASSRKVGAKRPVSKIPTSPTASKSASANNERTIRSKVNFAHKRRAKIWMEGDAEGYLSYYWDEAILVVDGGTITIPEFRHWLHATLEAGGGSLAMHLPPLKDVAISPLGDAATTIFRWSQRFRTAEGEVSDRTCFETNVWYQRNGVWKIVRLHLTTITKDVIKV